MVSAQKLKQIICGHDVPYMQSVSEIQGTTLGSCSMHSTGRRRLHKHRYLDASP